MGPSQESILKIPLLLFNIQIDKANDMDLDSTRAIMILRSSVPQHMKL